MKLSTYRVERLVMFLFLVPAIALLMVIVVPAVNALFISLTNDAIIGRGALNPQFVGLENFQRLFRDRNFYNSLRVTLLFVVFSALIGQLIVGLVAALLLQNPRLRFRNLAGAVILLPLAVPETVAALLWASMLAPGEYGTANRILEFLGIGSVLWLNQYPLLSIIIINIWRGIAFAMILFSSSLASLPTDIFDAAAVDGASSRQTFQFVTLPLLVPTILLFLLLTTVTTFAIFGLIYFLTAGGPARATEIIGIYIYNESFQFYQLGYGAAVAVIMLGVSLVLGVLYIRVLKVEI
jgi:multiple sugar transport system permease protein